MLAQGGGNLNKSIFESSNARGIARGRGGGGGDVDVTPAKKINRLSK